MINNDTLAIKVITHNQEPHESDEFYARRLIDPLDIALAPPETRVELVDRAKEGLRRSIENYKNDEAIEFAADYTYRSLGVVPAEHTVQAAKFGTRLVQHEIATNTSLTPSERLGLGMRVLDFESMQTFAEYQKDRPTRIPGEERNASTQLEASLFKVIRTGTALLQQFQKEHETLEDEEVKQDVRGKMFELLYMTYARLQIYQDEVYEEEIVVGATEFEDRSAKQFIPRNHNYDVLTLSADGEVRRVVQCKNGQSEKIYQPPIEKITGQAFGRFVNYPKPYLDALSQLVSNSAAVSEAQMRKNREVLDELFAGDHAAVPRHSGKAALVGAAS